MLPQTVIDRQVSRHPGVSLLGVLERHGVGPFLAKGLNESFVFAVGPWCVGPGADVLELEDAAGFGNGLGDVGRSVFAHHLTTLAAVTVEPGQCPTQETDRCALLLIVQHLEVIEPCSVSMATCTRSYPTTAERPCCRLPVMR